MIPSEPTSVTDAGGAITMRHGFDHATDPAMLTGHPYEWDRLRDQFRAFGSDVTPWGLWFPLRYDDLVEAFQRHDLLSSRQTLYAVTDTHQWIPAQVDPPDHTKYRVLLNPSFLPKRIADLDGAITEICTSLIDPVVADGRCDFVEAFCRRFPTTVFMRQMGLPVEEADTFLEWASALLHTTGDDDPDFAIRKGASKTIYRYLGELITSRRAELRDDLISELIDGQVDGRPVTDAELLEMAFLMYVAGMDTVAGMLSYVMRHLAEHPEHRALLREHPEAIPTAVEEFLRFYAIAAPARVVRHDMEFAGCPMRADDRVVLSTTAANRDPAQFADAEVFVIDRSPNRHVAFGAGIHRCLGSHLARAELRIAIEQWLARIPEFTIEPGAVITQHVGGAAGLDHLPLVWDVATTSRTHQGAR